MNSTLARIVRPDRAPLLRDNVLISIPGDRLVMIDFGKEKPSVAVPGRAALTIAFFRIAAFQILEIDGGGAISNRPFPLSRPIPYPG